MLKIILITLLMAIISGILYRFGGASKKGDWMDSLRNSITRDSGCSFLTISNLLLFFIVLNNYWWLSIISCGLLYGALTTYHTWTNKLLNIPKEDKYWFNWIITGFCYGLCDIIMITYTHQWIGFFSKLLFLTLSITLWTTYIKTATWSERGRGFFLLISNLFYLIK